MLYDYSILGDPKRCKVSSIHTLKPKYWSPFNIEFSFPFDPIISFVVGI